MPSPLCLCLKKVSECPSEDHKNVFVCIKCKNPFHISCYDNPTFQILNNTITCISCRLEIIEPYWSLNPDYLVPSSFLQFGRPFELSYTLCLPEEARGQGDKLKLALFCTKLRSIVTNNFCYEWPSEKIEVSLDGAHLEYNIYSLLFIEIGNFKKENDYQCELKIVCREPIQFLSVFGVGVASKVDMKDIAKEIAKKNKLNYEDAKQKYEEMKQSDLEFSAGIPIKDPMSSFLLYMPSRGLNCEHLSCFDLMNFLNFNKTNYNSSRWRCPLCKAVLNVNELVIDLFLYKIVKDIRMVTSKEDLNRKYDLDKISHIYFDENMEWKPKDKFSNQWNQNNKAPGKDKPELEATPPKMATAQAPAQRSPKNIEKSNEPAKEEKNQKEPKPSIQKETKPLEKERPVLAIKPNQIFIEIQEEDEKKPQTQTYLHECLMIIKTFLNSRTPKAESCFRIQQTFKENLILNYLNLNEFYQLIDQTLKLSNEASITVLEVIFFQKKKKKMEEIISELKSYFGFELVCKLLAQWSSNTEALLKIVYLFATKNLSKHIDFFKVLESLLLISEIISSNLAEHKEMLPENLKTLPEIFGFFLRVFTGLTKTYFTSNLKTILKFVSLLIPEFLFPQYNAEQNFKTVSAFLNSFLRKVSTEEFVDIILSLYPCSTKEPSFPDLIILKKQFRLWAEILSCRDPQHFSPNEIVKVIEKWNENLFLKEQIAKGKMNLNQLIISEF